MGNKKYNYMENNDGTVTLDFCEGVKDLSEPVIWDLDNIDGRITQVNIPSTVESINCRFVEDMMYVERFQVNPANEHFIEVDGCVYSADMRKLIAYPPNTAGCFFEIPSAVEVIAPWAFCCNNHLMCINIGSNVKVIGRRAFDRAYSLEHLYIDENVSEIEDFFCQCGDFDVYVNVRACVIVAGAAGSAVERWCRENATFFLALKDDQVNEFIASPVWTREIPQFSDEEYLACWDKRMEYTD